MKPSNRFQNRASLVVQQHLDRFVPCLIASGFLGVVDGEDGEFPAARSRRD